MLLHEIAIMNPHLTQTQQRVLCRIKIAPTSTIAAEQTQDDLNMVEARKQLARMGMISYDDEGGIVITDDGVSAMKREYLLDDMEELTDRGHEMVGTDDSETIPTV